MSSRPLPTEFPSAKVGVGDGVGGEVGGRVDVAVGVASQVEVKRDDEDVGGV